MAISERLQMVIKMNGLSNTAFAARIGVQRSSISHVLSGRNKPSIDFIQKILNEFPKVNADWLVTGRKVGKVSADSTKESSITHPTSTNQSTQTITESDSTETQTVKSQAITPEEKSSSKQIDKIVIFYTDGTFEEATTNTDKS